jgi:hypothetical protein
MGKRETGGHGEQPTGDLYVDALTKRNSLKAKMSRERIEIPVVVQQTQAFFDTVAMRQSMVDLTVMFLPRSSR